MTEFSTPIDLAPEHLALVRDILKNKLPNVPAFAFGSTNGNTLRKHADLDVALLPNQPIDWRVMADLREAFQDSSLPIRVDVIDWTTCTEDFKGAIGERISL
jgi:uncharacterized protein